MHPYIRITRHPYEEPYHINLALDASNGKQKWKLEFYDNAESLTTLADNLEIFPRHKDDVFLWELGSEYSEDRWAYYFRFRVFVTDAVGHCAIQIRFNNNQNLPDKEIVEFCIKAEACQINRLGQLFRKFAGLKHELLVWEGNNGALYESKHEAQQPRTSDAGQHR
jgi:hypothetical protein